MRSTTAMLVLGVILAAAAGHTPGWDRCRTSLTSAAAPVQPIAQPAATEKAKGAGDAVQKDILANAKLFVEAFNRHDVKAIVGLCTEDCEFTERDGSTATGPESAAAGYGVRPTAGIAQRTCDAAGTERAAENPRNQDR